MELLTTVVLATGAVALAGAVLVLARRRAVADERGMTTETVIITAVLAGLALVATAIIVDKVTKKADSIPTGEGTTVTSRP